MMSAELPLSTKLFLCWILQSWAWWPTGHHEAVLPLWHLPLRNTYLGLSIFALEEVGYEHCSPAFGMTSCGIWMILPWWFLFLLLHFVDKVACDPRPSESLRVGPCYHPWTCWNPPSSRTSAVSLFVWVLLSASSGLDSPLFNACDPYENGNISSYRAH